MIKVLIAEDEPPIARMIKTLIERADSDFKIEKTCINGKLAIDEIKNNYYDLIITDIKMPVMTGLELAGWVKTNRPKTLVVLLSGYQEFDYAREAIAHKVFDYLLKPLSPDKLKDLLNRVKLEINGESSSAPLANSNVKEDRHTQLANEVERYLIANYQSNITSDILSRKFGFVPSYISKIFKASKGISPAEYITKYRINLAKKLLLENPDILIKEVADSVGYKESYYFSKTFKKETGMWPTEFIKQPNAVVNEIKTQEI